MALIRIVNATFLYGDKVVLREANCDLPLKGHVGLCGRNGEGKSTLLSILTGETALHKGEVILPRGTRVSRLAQSVPQFAQKTVYEFLLQSHPVLGEDLLSYQNRVSQNDQSDALHQLTKRIEDNDGWSFINKVKTVISKLSLSADDDISSLSGGLKRRVLLAKALVEEPDLLLLDEPTNHLDIEAIIWLESFLKSFNGAFIIVSHDRAFLNQVTNTIVELDRGLLHTYDCHFNQFLKRQSERLANEEKQNQLFEKKLADEEVWIRKGIKARRTRNEGRVRALKKMREEAKKRLTKPGEIKQVSQTLKQSGKLIFEVNDVTYQIDEQMLIKDFSVLVSKGDKIGIIGPNGSGKSTLLRLLLQKIQPNSGDIKIGSQLEIGYFDQLRDEIDDNLNLIDNVADGQTEVMVNGKPTHVITYLKSFLFAPSQAHSLASRLSGGERNRLLLAKLFTKPHNTLILDEPTNDLDIETLEILESLLVDYKGTLLVVSHDREFLNNVTTKLWCFERNGHIEQVVGGYEDYLRTKASQEEKTQTKPTNLKHTNKKSNKLSYNEQRELKALPQQIENLEEMVEKMQNQAADSTFYQKPQDEIATFMKELETQQAKLNGLYERWQELEGGE